MSRRIAGHDHPDQHQTQRPYRWWTSPRNIVILLCIALVILGIPLAIARSGNASTMPSSSLRPGTYTGAVAGYGQPKLVTLVVGAGSRGRVTLQCGDTSAGTSASFSVSSGSFTAVDRTATGAERWTVQGTQTALADAPDVVAVHLALPRACDGIGGDGYLASE